MFRERQGPPGPGGWLRLWLLTLAGVRAGVLGCWRVADESRSLADLTSLWTGRPCLFGGGLKGRVGGLAVREAEKSPSPGCPAHLPAAAALPPGCFPLLAPARAWDAINFLVARAWRSHFLGPRPACPGPRGAWAALVAVGSCSASHRGRSISCRGDLGLGHSGNESVCVGDKIGVQGSHLLRQPQERLDTASPQRERGLTEGQGLRRSESPHNHGPALGKSRH